MIKIKIETTQIALNRDDEAKLNALVNRLEPNHQNATRRVDLRQALRDAMEYGFEQGTGKTVAGR